VPLPHEGGDSHDTEPREPALANNMKFPCLRLVDNASVGDNKNVGDVMTCTLLLDQILISRGDRAVILGEFLRV